MSTVTLENRYPKIFAALEEEVDELRYLVVVDQNFDDVDSDEFDAIDPEDYNFLVYVPERLQDVLGEQGMIDLVKALESDANIALFFLSDVDLYGVQTDLDEEALSHLVLGFAETFVPKVAA